MQIYLLHGQERIGPYTEEMIHSGFATGVFSPEQLAWTEGQNDWQPVRDLIPKLSTQAHQIEEESEIVSDEDDEETPEMAFARLCKPKSKPTRREKPSTPPVRDAPVPPLGSTTAPAIWNPLVAAAWSFLFTPIFGSILVAMNWRTLGQSSKARTSWIWVAGVVLFFYVWLKMTDTSSFGVFVGAFILWFLLCPTPQILHVRRNFGEAWNRRKWVWPVVCAAGLSFALSVALIGFGVFLVAANQSGANASYSPEAINEIYRDHIFEVRVTWKEHGGLLWLQTVQEASLGTGVMIVSDGKQGVILTNWHVVEYPTSSWDRTCEVRSAGMDHYIPASIIGRGKNGLDVAWLSIEPGTALRSEKVPLKRMADLRIGEACVAIGNTLGAGLSVTTGTVSHFDQFGDQTMIRISAPISHGNSGGPVFVNSGAALIGIVRLSLGADKAQNVNFVIPIEDAADPRNLEFQ